MCVFSYVSLPFDLSRVIFVATANRPPPHCPRLLLDRMEVIESAGVHPEEKKRIALRHLVPTHPGPARPHAAQTCVIHPVSTRHYVSAERGLQCSTTIQYYFLSCPASWTRTASRPATSSPTLSVPEATPVPYGTVLYSALLLSLDYPVV